MKNKQTEQDLLMLSKRLESMEKQGDVGVMYRETVKKLTILTIEYFEG
jgi:hypothetical protein